MYYEINISRRGSHLFATAPRSVTDRETFKEVMQVLKQKFPIAEGYKIEAWRCTNSMESVAQD
jgi:hypothetical protein